MKTKLFKLSISTLILALAIFVFSYFLYHYMGPDGHWITQWQTVPAKPMITELFSIWGVMFLFSSVMSTLVAVIFFPNKKDR